MSPEQLAAFLYNFLQQASIPMPTRDAEVMAMAKEWLKDQAQPKQEAPDGE